jgi:hypothetical protein
MSSTAEAAKNTVEIGKKHILDQRLRIERQRDAKILLLCSVFGIPTPVRRNQMPASFFMNRLAHGRFEMKMLVALLVVGVALGAGASANAKGCIKGAIVGGVAGHMAGHGAAGAAAGCVIGHHEANKRQNANQNR